MREAEHASPGRGWRRTGARGWASAVVALSLCACAADEAGAPDWSDYDGPGAAYFDDADLGLPTVDDPLEPVNRGVYTGNDWLITYLVDPALSAYRFVVPELLRTGLRNAFVNALYPGRLVNNLLQAKFDGAWEETRRFGVNTTVGLLGFRDVASDRAIARSDEDFGQTFAVWGWSESTYFVLPFFGPSSIRDAVGFVGDTLADPAFYYPPASTWRIVNRLSDEVRGLLDLMNSHYDEYELTRTLYVQARQAEVEDLEATPVTVDEPAAPPFLRPLKPGFGVQADVRRVRLEARGEPLPYQLWMQPGTAPVVAVLPDFGGFRGEGKAVAVAEVAWSLGFSVLTVSDSWNWEFARAALVAEQPGHLLFDGRDVLAALAAVFDDLEAAHPGRLGPRSLVGLGHGGMNALVVAALEAGPEGRLAGFERYVAINAGVDLGHCVQVMDALGRALTELPPKRRRDTVAGIFGKALEVDEGRLRPVSDPLPFTVAEARVLAGLAFRNTIRDLIVHSQERADMQVLRSAAGDRRARQAEAVTFSGMAYLHAFLLPAYAALPTGLTADDDGARQMLAQCRFELLADALADQPGVRFVTSPEDPLLTPDDRQWISRLLGDERVLTRPGRGFLGHLDREAVREVLAEVLPGAGRGETDTHREAQHGP